MVKISKEVCQELISYLQSCDDAHAEGLAEELQAALAAKTYEEMSVETKTTEGVTKTKGGSYII